jgi:hypothetical protein
MSQGLPLLRSETGTATVAAAPFAPAPIVMA